MMNGWKWVDNGWVWHHQGQPCPYEVKIWTPHPLYARADPRAELARFEVTCDRIADMNARIEASTRHRYKLDHDVLSEDAYEQLCEWSITCCATLGCPAALPLPYREAAEGEDYDLADKDPFSGSYTIGKTLAGHPVIYIKADEMELMRRTTAHEVAHVHQHYAKVSLTRDEAEAHAEAFADTMMAELHQVEPEYALGHTTYRPDGVPILACYHMGGARIAGGYTRAYKVLPGAY